MKAPATMGRHLIAAIVALSHALAPGPAAAEPGHHQAHVHGVAKFTLALEDPRLELVLTSPANSIIGFEHKASSPDEVMAVVAAQSRLRDTTTLFSFIGADCALQTVDIDMTAVMESDAGEATAQDERDHHEADHHHKENGSHTDISARYSYNCTTTTDLRALRVGQDALLFGLETIEVMWVSDRGQGATVLTQDNRIIEFN